MFPAARQPACGCSEQPLSPMCCRHVCGCSQLPLITCVAVVCPLSAQCVVDMFRLLHAITRPAHACSWPLFENVFDMFRLLYAITQPARGCSQLPLCLYSATPALRYHTAHRWMFKAAETITPKVSPTCFACSMPPLSLCAWMRYAADHSAVHSHHSVQSVADMSRLRYAAVQPASSYSDVLEAT